MADDAEKVLNSGLDVAIIGMAGRFPGAASVEALWTLLRDGKEGISFFLPEEMDANPLPLGRGTLVRAGAVLDGVDLFDAAFFEMSAREAQLTDPQHRLFLERAWEALEDAGHDPESYPGTIGVYAGSSANTYLLFNLQAANSLGSVSEFIRAAYGNDKDFLPSRVSFKLNLRGPSIAVQTACSTSLVAVHLACQSLLNRECDMALAGAACVRVPHKIGYIYELDGILSPDGHCRAFDAAAQGTVPGNGAAVVVLKRLEDALADGDTIRAVIKGSAVNNDGSRKVSEGAPSLEGQAAVIAEAMAVAGVDAASISYVEAHGTGTYLGDSIEMAALAQAFASRDPRKQTCAVGSVKTNVGYLETAAGVTGLIKTVLALQHRQLPPTLHFQHPNPVIDFANSPFHVNASLTAWQGPAPRRAGVSAFGMGGTNAHVILEEAPAAKPSGPARPWQLLVLSARSPAALDAVRANLVRYLQNHATVNLADVAYTLQVGRRHFRHRWIAVCRTAAEAVAQLTMPLTPDSTAAAQSDNRPQESLAVLADCTGDASLPDALRTLGRQWLQGKRGDWRQVAGEEPRQRLSLPTYPFERQRYWLDGSQAVQQECGEVSSGSANQEQPARSPTGHLLAPQP